MAANSNNFLNGCNNPVFFPISVNKVYFRSIQFMDIPIP